MRETPLSQVRDQGHRNSTPTAPSQGLWSLPRQGRPASISHAPTFISEAKFQESTTKRSEPPVLHPTRGLGGGQDKGSSPNSAGQEAGVPVTFAQACS